MQKLIIMCITVFVVGCNTKSGSEQPTVDSRLNPAEMPVDTVDRPVNIIRPADNNPRQPGNSSLQVGGSGSDTTRDIVLGSDGTIVKENKKDSVRDQLPAGR